MSEALVRNGLHVAGKAASEGINETSGLPIRIATVYG